VLVGPDCRRRIEPGRARRESVCGEFALLVIGEAGRGCCRVRKPCSGLMGYNSG
jgi:hypothetical protein